jgi:hypothetical protein
MDRRFLEVSYSEPGKEEEIAEWAGKTVKSAKVVHYGGDGKLTIKAYGFNDLAFWDEERYR